MRPHQKLFTPANANLTGFLSNATGASWTLTATAASDGLAHQVSIRNDSANDHSAKTATLTGTDADGRAQTETLNLPGASATVESTKYFKTLTSVVPSATIGADTMDIGFVDEFVTPTFPLNWRGGDVGFNIGVSGTISYTVQHTFDHIQSETGEFAFYDNDDTDLVTATASKNGNYTQVPTGMRVMINSYSNGATLELSIAQKDA